MSHCLLLCSAKGPIIAGVLAIRRFRDFFEEHASFVLRSVRHLGAREADALDLTQEVFTIAYQKRDQLTQPEGGRSWLYRICFGVVRNHQRRAPNRREIPTDGAAPRLEKADHAAPDPVERQQTRRQLLEVLDAIDEEKRVVLIAYVIEELSMKEIADTFEIPLKTAYSRLYAARRQALSAHKRLTTVQRTGSDHG